MSAVQPSGPGALSGVLLRYLATRSERRKRSTLRQGKLYTTRKLPIKQPSYGSKTPDPRDVGSCCCTQKSRPDLVALVALVGADKFNGHAQQPPWHTITFQVDASASVSRHTFAGEGLYTANLTTAPVHSGPSGAHGHDKCPHPTRQSRRGFGVARGCVSRRLETAKETTPTRLLLL